MTPWRNGSASDSRSEGCVFESRRGQINFSSSCKIIFQLEIRTKMVELNKSPFKVMLNNAKEF